MQFICATEKYCTLEEHVAAPIFRRSFDVIGEVRSAVLDVTVTGFYELYVNGMNITKGLLAPYISNPDHVLYLDSYDIAPYLKAGKNAVALILGNGFTNQGVTSWDFDTASFRSAPRLALEVKISAEGGDVSIYSDESFKTAPSPILFDMYRFGVIYDAREEREGFSLPDYDDSEWSFALLAEPPKGKITPSRAVPIRVREELRPKSILRQSDFHCLHYKSGEPMNETYIEDGYLYDFGVNAAGACRLRIKGKRGQKITIRHGESLRDGFFDIGSTITIKSDTPTLISYLQTDVYYLKGGEEEIFFPSFTYHGFRYAFVEGITPEQATPDLLTYEIFNTDIGLRADFECSDATVNRLYEMTLRADLSNFHHFPTDCPHREKNGWTGDASVSAHQLLLAFDCADALGVWLESARYAQLSSGMLPGIVPTATWGYEWGSGPAWDAAIINLPYYSYRYDGRLDIIRENADMIERYLHYIDSRRDERGLVACGLGDWCQPRPDGAPISSPLEFTDSLQIIEMAGKSAVMLDAVGRSEASAYARDLEARMRHAVRDHLIDGKRAIASGECQTSQALALRFGLFTEEEKPRAYRALLDMIATTGAHVDCGMIGLRHIFHVLFENGDSDLALYMITRDDAPSYGSMIKLGGTSLFESLIPNGLNESENHHFYGDILHLFIAKLVGIRVNPTLTDKDSAVITPTFPVSISHASAGYRFASGRLGVSWQRVSDTRIRVEFSVPFGVSLRFEWGEYSREIPTGDSALELELGNEQTVGEKIFDYLFSSADKSADETPSVAIPIGKNLVKKDYELIFSTESYAVVGGKSCGKSSLLGTLVLCGAMKYSPDELVMWLADCRGEGELFARLPHVRRAERISAPAELLHFLTDVLHEIEARRMKFLEAEERFDGIRKIPLLDAYNRLMTEHGGETMPHLLVMVDGLDALLADGTSDTELFDSIDSLLSRVITIGVSCGVHPIFFADSARVKDLRRLLPSVLDLSVCEIDLRATMESFGQPLKRFMVIKGVGYGYRDSVLLPLGEALVSTGSLLSDRVRIAYPPEHRIDEYVERVVKKYNNSYK